MDKKIRRKENILCTTNYSKNCYLKIIATKSNIYTVNILCSMYYYVSNYTHIIYIYNYCNFKGKLTRYTRQNYN